MSCYSTIISAKRSCISKDNMLGNWAKNSIPFQSKISCFSSRLKIFIFSEIICAHTRKVSPRPWYRVVSVTADVGNTSSMQMFKELLLVTGIEGPHSWWRKIPGEEKKGLYLSNIQREINTSTSQILVRFTAAGVFSKCLLSGTDCCIDPVVYTRTATLAAWIWEKAPGVSSSAGCPRKPVRST